MIKTIKIFMLAAALLTLAPHSYANYLQYPKCYHDCQKWGIKLLGHIPTDAVCLNQCSLDCSYYHRGCINLCKKIKKQHATLLFIDCKDDCKKVCVTAD